MRRSGGGGTLTTLAVLATLVAPVLAVPWPASAAAISTRAAPLDSAQGLPTGGPPALYLVALETPGTATQARGLAALAPRGLLARPLLAAQDEVIARLDAPEPTYRWTTALNAMAVELDPAQARRAARLPGVVSVERNAVRPVAAAATHENGLATTSRSLPSAVAPGAGSRRGGAGVVIGMVDTGLAPDSPLFAQRRATSTPGDLGAACDTGPGWPSSTCAGKIYAGRWFVDGFGADRLRAASTLSPLDTDGHGTLSASIAAGNSGVPVRLGGERQDRYAGAAPAARLAVYKACWSAPDPRLDGCASADLVAAVDQATADGVDVLSLAVGGPSRIDVLERALLGATEAGTLVVAAAGNAGPGSGAAHSSPWVLTVGATTGPARLGRVELVGGPRLGGAMTSGTPVGRTRIVLAGRVAARGVDPDRAAVCTPGALDAARVGDRVVVCERGGRVGRVDKSRAVALADGVGMVLVNRRGGPVDADVHSVPTVHLAAAPGRRLTRWVAGHPGAQVRLAPRGLVPRPPEVASFSSGGRAVRRLVKPDVVAPAVGVPGAVPGGWDLATGTSAATARVAGLAARLLALGHSPARVRSALVTTAAPVRRATPLRAGAGVVRAGRADRPGLAYLTRPGEQRDWLEGRRRWLNTPGAVLRGGAGEQLTAQRRITNVSGRRLYFSSSARGFRRDVVVTPAAARLGRGESETFTVHATGARRPDHGWVVWRGARGSVTRIAVLVAP